jgi:hypothetical protein
MLPRHFVDLTQRHDTRVYVERQGQVIQSRAEMLTISRRLWQSRCRRLYAFRGEYAD